MSDKLDNLFKMQRRMQERMGYNYDEMNTEQLVAYIKEYTLHTTHELHEMLAELPYFKPWKKVRYTRC